MSKQFGSGGYDEIEKELERQRQNRENNQSGSRIRDFWCKSGEQDIFVRFLTREPLTARRHSAWHNGKWTSITCRKEIGESCPLCDAGDKPALFGAHLLVDRRTFESRSGDQFTNEIKVLCLKAVHVAGFREACINLNGDDDLRKEWKLVKSGEKTSTRYSIYPRPTEPIPPEEREKYKAILAPYVKGWKAFCEETGHDTKSYPLEKFVLTRCLMPLPEDEMAEIARSLKKEHRESGNQYTPPPPASGGSEEEPEDDDYTF